MSITISTRSYYEWGNHTPRFGKVVDAVDRREPGRNPRRPAVQRVGRTVESVNRGWIAKAGERSRLAPGAPG
jgi:hypothetical protein